jgi:hypothetical protein
MNKSLIATALAVVGIAAVSAPDALAMTSFSEVLGNEPVTEGLEWPIGVFALANLESRVLHRSKSSGMVEAKDDEFFYRGSAHELNDALALFAQVESERLEVVLLPGSPEEALWIETDVKTVPYDWKLHVPGTYRRQAAEREEATQVYAGWPNMTVHTGGWVALDEIEIPAGVTVLGPADLTTRYVEGLASDDRNVRWQAATYLQRVAPYADSALPPLLGALGDEDLYVRCAAADSLSRFGPEAAAALPKIREMLAADDLDPGPRRTLSEALRRIEESSDEGEDGKRLAAQAALIEEFCKPLTGGEAVPAAGDG